jgi:hypothetical protein
MAKQQGSPLMSTPLAVVGGGPARVMVLLIAPLRIWVAHSSGADNR